MGNKHSMVKELAAVAYEDARTGRYRHAQDVSLDSSSVMSSSPRSSTASGPYERVHRKVVSPAHHKQHISTDHHLLVQPTESSSLVGGQDIASAHDCTFDSTDGELVKSATVVVVCNAEDEDDDHDEDVVTDKVAAHTVPLIIEVPPDDEELTEMSSFSREFASRYGDQIPDFFNGSLSNAVQAVTAVDGSNVMKPIMIYLHHTGNPDTDAFAKNVLCCPDFMEYANNTFLIWGWNMKDGPDRQKFHQMVEDHLDSETITRILTFGVSDYPVIVLLLKTSSEISLSQVVDGNRSLDEIIAILMTAHEVFQQMQQDQLENPELMDLDCWGKKLWEGENSNSIVAKQQVVSPAREQNISLGPQVAHVAPTMRGYQRAKPNHYEFANPTNKTTFENHYEFANPTNKTTFEGAGESQRKRNVSTGRKPSCDEIVSHPQRTRTSTMNSSEIEAHNNTQLDRISEKMHADAEITHYKKIITETASMLTELQDGVEDEVEKLKASVAEKEEKITELQNRIAQHIYENIPADNIQAATVGKQKVSGDWS